MNTQTEIVTLTRVSCCECGCLFGIESSFNDSLLNNGRVFYCPNGHTQHYAKKERLEKKIKELENKNKNLECRIDICKDTDLLEVIEYRFYNRCRTEGLKTIGQILDLGEIEFRNIYGVGDVAVGQINNYLSKYNLKLL
jgi:hypothetical protein